MRLDRFVVEEALDVSGKVGGRSVAVFAVFLECLEGDHVSIAAQLAPERLRIGAAVVGRDRGGVTQAADFCARPHDVVFAQRAEYLGVSDTIEIVRQDADQQLVEHDAKGIDIAAGIDILTAGVCLLGAHVAQRADDSA